MGFRGFIPVMLGIAVAGVHAIHAQQPDPAARVRIHTVMERYAPEYVLPPDERRRLKSERRDTIASRRAVIDTLDISRRKRRRLLRELYHTPFSDEYREVLSTLELEDGEESEYQIPD
jgi:hypothetical protein